MSKARGRRVRAAVSGRGARLRRRAPSLDGVWALERTGGLLPPLAPLRKQIARGRGRTTLGPLPGPGFDVRGLELRYRVPFRGFVDVLVPAGRDVFAGRATLLGRTVGRFRMRRVEANRAGRR
jgi:hypothetical protein